MALALVWGPSACTTLKEGRVAAPDSQDADPHDATTFDVVVAEGGDVDATQVPDGDPGHPDGQEGEAEAEASGPLDADAGRMDAEAGGDAEDADAGPDDADADAGGDTGDADASADGDICDGGTGVLSRPPSNPTWSSNLPGSANWVGSGWMVGTNPEGDADYEILRWDGASWTPIPNIGGQSISVDLNGTPWVVDHAGQIWKWNCTAFARFPSASDTFQAAQVASGSVDTETWALKATDGTVWHWTGTSWSQSPGAGMGIAVFSTPDTICGDHLPVVIGTDGNIYFYVHSDCSTVPYTSANGAGSSLSTDFLVDTQGYLDRWNASNGTWAGYMTAPWGTNTQIAAWSEGIFARDGVSQAVRKIQ